uniref:Chloride channel CLIC-like protein 1 n=1 Tax=Meloidogyne hapla TaxID=6305 RepID=A0A1I8BN47_MELHA
MLPYLMLLNLLLILPASIILIRWVCSFRRLCFVVFVSAFGLSYYFAYIRKYQEVLAQRFERANWDGSKHPCTPRGLMSEAFDVLLSYDILIEPILLVDPLQVLAEVLSNFVLSPFSIAGLHLNRFFIKFFENTPIHFALLMAVLLCLMPILIVWTFLRIREHVARERREDEHKKRLEKINHSTIQSCSNTLPVADVTDERERKLRRRVGGHGIIFCFKNNVYNGALVDKKDQPVVTGDKQNTDASSSTNNFMCLIVFCPAGDGYSNPAYAGYGYSYSNPGYAYSSAYYPNNYGYSSYGSSNYYCYYSPSYCYGYGSGYYGK